MPIQVLANFFAINDGKEVELKTIKLSVRRGIKVCNFVKTALDDANLSAYYQSDSVQYSSKKFGKFVEASGEEKVKNGRQYNIKLIASKKADLRQVDFVDNADEEVDEDASSCFTDAQPDDPKPTDGSFIHDRETEKIQKQLEEINDASSCSTAVQGTLKDINSLNGTPFSTDIAAVISVLEVIDDKSDESVIVIEQTLLSPVADVLPQDIADDSKLLSTPPAVGIVKNSGWLRFFTPSPMKRKL